MKWTGITDIGKIRKQNEDYYILPDTRGTYRSFASYGVLAVVCDGMGGALAGEVASEKAAVFMKKNFYEILLGHQKKEDISWLESEEHTEKIQDIMKQAVRQANHEVWKLSMEHDSYRGMGTTLAAAWVTTHFAVFGSVGDSRGYIYHNQHLRQITEDQSYVWDLYKQGAITKDQIRFHPMNHLMNLAVGVEEELQDEQIGTWAAALSPGDIVMLCSDGLSDILSDDAMEAVFRTSAPLEQTAQRLIDAGNETSGKDNMTVVLVGIEEK